MFIAQLIAKLLDPISFVITLAIVLSSRSKWIILISALLSSVISETLLDMTQVARVWGIGLPAGVAAGLVHASIIYYIRSRVAKSRSEKSTQE